MNPIPFIDKESLTARDSLRPKIKPFSKILRIRARTRTPVAIKVTNPNLKEGYLPQLETPQGLYLGEAIESSNDGACHAIVVKTTEEDIDLELTPEELIPFDFWKYSGEEFTDSETKIPRVDLEQTYSDRVIKVKNALHVLHLNPEERKVVYKWAEDYADIFHLNWEPLTCTHSIQHRIPTIDEKVIHRKQYRSPTEALHQIKIQLQK